MHSSGLTFNLFISSFAASALQIILSQHFELRNNYRVHELIEMTNQLDARSAQQIFDVCRISHLMMRKSDELSGGEKQRIALAKQLTSFPKLLLLDEPFSNLDRVHKELIRSVIEDICTTLKVTCLLVSHDATDLLSWADRIIIMQDGQVVQQVTDRSILLRKTLAVLHQRYQTEVIRFMSGRQITPLIIPVMLLIVLR